MAMLNDQRVYNEESEISRQFPGKPTVYVKNPMPWSYQELGISKMSYYWVYIWVKFPKVNREVHSKPGA